MQADVSLNKVLIDRLFNQEITEAQDFTVEKVCDQAQELYLMAYTTGNNTGNISYSLKLFLDDGLIDTITGTISASTGTDNPVTIETLAENVTGSIKNATRYVLTLSFLHSADYTPKIMMGKAFEAKSSASGYPSGTVISSETLASLIAGIINPSTEGNDGELKFFAVDKLGRLKLANFDDISTSAKTSRVDPDALVKLPLKLLVNATNEAAATYRTIIDFQGYDNATINVICAGGITVTLFGTNNDAADDSADTGWVSLSTSSIVDTTDGWQITGQAPWDRLMIKRVASDASNSTVIDVNLGG